MEKSKTKERHLPSRSSSSDSGEELRWLQRLEAERLWLKEEKKKQKEQVKANETPAEKRARRLRKKQEKGCKYREQMGWDNKYQCYTNQDNPFGDSALTDTFVWIKKLVKEGVKTVSRDELRALSRQKQLENKIELEKVKQRRLALEAVRVAKSKTDAAAATHSRTWARREDAFQLHQARLRSQIRIRDGRAKPIDLLAKYVSSECVDALGMHEPYAYLHGLQSQELEDLLEDIKVYKELESGANQAYWEDVQSIVLHELDKLRRLDAPAAPRCAVHQAVADDVTQIFKGKTVAQLQALQRQMEHKMRGRQGGVDVAFWEALLSQLKAHIPRARLRERHQRLLRRQLPPLQRERAGQCAAATQHAEEPRRSQSPEVKRAATPMWPLVVEPGAEQHLELYRPGRYSPAPLGALPPGAPLTHAAHDEARQARLRSIAAGRQLLDQMEPAVSSVGDQLQLSALRSRPDPCLPRKPRYYNRVHTGFEWNKYNQTHYDVDHPPPKTVQGYKFNIFYPDLIDKTAMPEFSLKAYPENPDLAIVHFHAGAPYEDIAFKIVNREWDCSHKRGFRCHFHNNIFQLWFHFKRYRYRR